MVIFFFRRMPPMCSNPLLSGVEREEVVQV